MPMTHVIIPPVLNDIILGLIFANPFEGLTTFAAMFVDSVATVKAMSEIITRVVEPSSPTSKTGSLIANPKITNGSRSHRDSNKRKEGHRCW